MSGNERFRNQFSRYASGRDETDTLWRGEGRGEGQPAAMNNGGCLSKFLKYTTIAYVTKGRL